MFTLTTVPTRQELCDAWSKASRELDEETARRCEALADEWLASDMSAIEKDRRLEGIQRWRAAQIEAEKCAWYDGLRALERVA